MTRGFRFREMSKRDCDIASWKGMDGIAAGVPAGLDTKMPCGLRLSLFCWDTGNRVMTTGDKATMFLRVGCHRIVTMAFRNV